MLVLAITECLRPPTFPIPAGRDLADSPNEKRGFMHTIDQPRDDYSKSPKRRLAKGLGLAALIGAALPIAALAFDRLNVDVPFLPAVGESAAEACDSDGVTTSFAYGNTSSNGIKVTSVTVDGIAGDCTDLTIDFMEGETAIASYSGAVVGATTTLTTSVWTDTFTSVRVLLGP